MQQARQNYSNIEVMQHSNCLPIVSGIVGVLSLLFFMAIESTTPWASHTILAGLWTFLSASSGVVTFVCASVVAWHFHKSKRRLDREQEQTLLIRRTSNLIASAQRSGDNVELVYGEDGTPLRVKVIRTTVLAEQARRERARIVESDQTTIAGLIEAAGKPPQEDEKPLPLPKAPAFRDMKHLITEKLMPLCFVVDDNEQSPTYGQTIPANGTIHDLLSLAVIGKPGRGKTVLLMYYACILLRNGSEVHIFDPHGVMGELALLHGHRLPNMPETARVFYYDTKEAMAKAIPQLLEKMKDRDKLYRPHLENGKLVSRGIEHPLLILADELPILADFDDQNKAEYKELNKERKAEGEPLLEVPLLGYLIRRIVLEARKWNMYFIGSSQSIDATILPTKVTDALNSRIVFFNSDRKARLIGLEADVIKKMLPVIRRAGPGVTIYDCARWDAPKIGAIPHITVEDMLEFLGLSMEDLEALWMAENAKTESSVEPQTRTTGPLIKPAEPSELEKALAAYDAGNTTLDALALALGKSSWLTRPLYTQVKKIRNEK